MLSTSATRSVGPALNRPVVDSRHSVTVSTLKGKLPLLEAGEHFISGGSEGGWGEEGGSKIQSGNIPVM